MDRSGPGSSVLKVQARQPRACAAVAFGMRDEVRFVPLAAVRAKEAELIFVTIGAVPEANSLPIAVQRREFRHAPVPFVAVLVEAQRRYWQVIPGGLPLEATGLGGRLSSPASVTED